jgi:hypothetical protein
MEWGGMPSSAWACAVHFGMPMSEDLRGHGTLYLVSGRRILTQEWGGG